MSGDNSIVLICNDEAAASEIRSKLILLRDVDSINVSTFQNAEIALDKSVPDCIIIFSSNEKDETLELISRIKSDLILRNTPIILASTKFEQEFVLSAFDDGISDYINYGSNEAELLMRVIWALQKNDMQRIIENRKELLAELNVIDKSTGIYSKEYTQKVFEGEFKDIFKYKSYASFMIISPDISSKNKLSPTFLASVIKKSTRNSDIIGQTADNKFYVLLKKTKTNGVLIVYERIKNSLNGGATVSAGALEIGKKLPLEKIIEATEKSLTMALEQTGTILFSENNKKQETGSWIDKVSSSQKNFKLFKQAFIKKLDNVITPIFYQMQKKLESQLLNTRIQQRSSETISTFSLQKYDCQSVLKISYPGFAKVNIDIMNVFGQEQFEDRTMLDISELNEQKLIDMFEKMIHDFRKKADA